jgi:hypothetical protein
MWVRFRFIMARRRSGEGLLAPPLLTLPSATDRDAFTRAQDGHPHKRQARHARYPAIDVYSTKQENVRWVRQHRATFVVPF